MPALANQDLSWLDDELSGPPALPAPATPAPSVITNPANPGDPNAEAPKTKDNKRRKAKQKRRKSPFGSRCTPQRKTRKTNGVASLIQYTGLFSSCSFRFGSTYQEIVYQHQVLNFARTLLRLRESGKTRQRTWIPMPRTGPSSCGTLCVCCVALACLHQVILCCYMCASSNPCMRETLSFHVNVRFVCKETANPMCLACMRKNLTKPRRG